ncbi:hemolysin D, partial [Morganella morganii]
MDFYLILIIVLAGGGYLYHMLQSPGLPEGFAQSNGRIEATEIDISTKTAGRISTINVREGICPRRDVLAQMDTRTLAAQLSEAQAQHRQADSNVISSRSALAQRKSEKAAAEAMVRQRTAELTAAQKRLTRSQALVRTNAVSVQQVDDDLAVVQGARAAAEAAKAQVAAASAAIDAAQSGIIQAQTKVDAALATQHRIEADLDDSQLKA